MLCAQISGGQLVDSQGVVRWLVITHVPERNTTTYIQTITLRGTGHYVH